MSDNTRAEKHEGHDTKEFKDGGFPNAHNGLLGATAGKLEDEATRNVHEDER